MIDFHEGHALRRGPMIDFKGGTRYVCIDCRSHGIAPYELIKDAPHWTEQDYWDNVDWIEA